MGRPKATEKRDQQLNLRLTSVEYNTVKARAVNAGMRLVDYGRMRLLVSREAQQQTKDASRIDRLVYVQLRRLGNNLNQLVRKFHATGDPTPDELHPLLKEVREFLRRRVLE